VRRLFALSLCLGCTQAPPAPVDDPVEDPVVARIGDAVIRRSEAERGVAMEIHRRRLDIHTLVRREVEALVEQRLLAAEAERRGVTVQAMLDDVERGEPVDDADVDAYLLEHGLGEERRERARDYLDGRRRIERRLAFVRGLEDAAQVRIDLEPPPLPRVDIDLEGAPSRGPADAAVTIVHFGALSEARSREVASWIEAVRQRHPKKIREVFRHVLNPRDELGLQAALLARSAQEKDRFWSVHDRLFQRDGALRQSDLQTLGEELELKPVTPEAEARTRDIVALKGELEIARKSGVTSPPGIFVNGLWVSHSFGRARFESRVRDALASSSVREPTRK
jgi:hypothetical protein